MEENNNDKEKEIENLVRGNKELTEKIRKLQEELGSMKKEKDELTEDFENRVEKVIEDLNEVVKITEKEKDKVTKDNLTLDELNKKLHSAIKQFRENENNLKQKIKQKNVEKFEMMKIREFEYYEITEYEQIGSGGFGQIYKAKYRGQTVAIKEMEYHSTSISELLFMNKVNLENLVTGICLGVYADRLHVVMKLYDCDLKTYLEAHPISGETDTGWLSSFTRDAVKATIQMHSLGMMHRDIKPRNFLVDKGSSLKLCDFGLVKFGLSADNLAGTPGYMAPEIDGTTTYTELVDEWSLGSTIYEMLMGERLVEDIDNKSASKYPLQRWHRMKIKMDEYPPLISKLLKRKPEKRMTAAELFKKLELLK